MALFTRFLEQRVTSYQTVWGADLDNDASPFAGPKPTRDRVLGLSAVFACVRILADIVATLPLHAYARQGRDRVLLDHQPDWIAQPVPRDPSITRVVHFQQVVTSLLLAGESFTLAAPDIFRPAELRVLDPRTVEIKRASGGAVLYQVQDHRGGVVGEFDWTQMLHIPLIRLAGELRGLSPLEAERQLFAGALAVDELAAKFARNGLWLSAVVEIPAGQPGPADPDEFIQRIEQKWSGSGKAGKVGMLTGGATIRQLSVTPEQAQFLETMQYSDERTFRIYRCPPSLMGMTASGAGSFALSAQEAVNFEKFTIRPIVETIEPAYNLLLGGGRYVKFQTKDILKGDPKTQSDIYHAGLTDKWLLLDEVRAFEDLPPDDRITGLLETPNNNAPGSPPEPQEIPT